MKYKSLIIGFMFVFCVETYAQKTPEKILQNALINEVTLNYSYEEIPDNAIKNRVTTIKQRRNSDGSVWRVIDTKSSEELSKRFWSFDTKIIYNSEGCVDLWISQYEISGIVTQEEIPLHKIGKDSEFKISSIVYDGRNCWKITEHQVKGEVYEFIIDKKHEFILASNYYNSSGKLLFPTQKKNVKFNPIFNDDDFRIPPNAKLSYAKNQEEFTKLSVKRVQKHSNAVIKKREQLGIPARETPGKIKQQWDRITNHDTFGFFCQKAPWFLLPVAIVTIGIVFWRKRKDSKS